MITPGGPRPSRRVAVEAAGAVEEVAAELRRGGVAIVPTDTVYGLAVMPDDDEALARIFRAKGRPLERKLPVLAGELEQVVDLGVELTPIGRRLAERFWPGALTIVFGFGDRTRPGWLVARDEVAVRIPDLEFLRAVMRLTGVLLVTSANAHGEPTPPTAADAAASLLEGVDVVVEAGQLVASPSTLVNTHRTPAVVERAGSLPLEELERFGVVAAPERPG